MYKATTHTQDYWVKLDDFGYPGYSINSYGNVKSDRYSDRILNHHKNPQGHLYVSLRLRGRQINVTVARLVLNAFTGPPEGENKVVLYIDGDKTNVHISNLSWSTRHKAFLHRRDVERAIEHRYPDFFDREVVEILSGERFNNIPSAAAHYDISPLWVYSSLRGVVLLGHPDYNLKFAFYR